MATIETLVVLQAVNGQVPAAAALQLRTRFHVAAALPPRLFVVRLPHDELPALQALPVVAATGTDPARLSAIPPLSESERLFADGWAARGIKSGPRAGDGLAWNAPGFDPPDKQGP